MRVTTIVGARPQFIKAAPVSKALREAGHHEKMVHTGQHYDYGLSQIFFDEMGISRPAVNLGVGSSTHARQTGEMLMRVEEVLLAQHQDWVVVYGDTNSTLAGALAACKLCFPLAHVEGGLRSFNRRMPEEHNRILTDHCSDLLFCPTETAAENLAREGITQGVHLVGDTMHDAVLQFAATARKYSTILKDLNLHEKGYLLATIHRPSNTDVPENLHNIMSALLRLQDTIVFPVHPRARSKIAEIEGLLNCWQGNNVTMIDPVGYLDMLMLERHARMILTDSGGVQKEAYWLGVPCITLREETEWVETVASGWNILVGCNTDRIVQAAERPVCADRRAPVCGDGHAAERIVRRLEEASAGPPSKS